MGSFKETHQRFPHLCFSHRLTDFGRTSEAQGILAQQTCTGKHVNLYVGNSEPHHLSLDYAIVLISPSPHVDRTAIVSKHNLAAKAPSE
jgi:hypothetical protein